MVAVLIHGVIDSLSRGKKGEGERSERVHEGREAMQRIVRDVSAAYISLHVPTNQALVTEKTAFIGRSSIQFDRLDFSAFAHLRTERDSHESDQAEVGYFVVPDPEVPEKMDLVRREQTPIDIRSAEGRRRQRRRRGRSKSSTSATSTRMTGQWVETWDTTQITGQPNRLPLEVSDHPRAQGRRRRGRPTLHDEGLPPHPATPLASGSRSNEPLPRTEGPEPRGRAEARRPRSRTQPRARRRAHHGARRDRHHGRHAGRVPGRRGRRVRGGHRGARQACKPSTSRAARSTSRGSSSPRSPRCAPAIAPLFMLMKQTPPQLPVWHYSDRILGAFNDKDAPDRLPEPRRLDLSQRQEPRPQGRALRGLRSSTKTRRST